MDADLSSDPKDIKKQLRFLKEKSDLIIDPNILLDKDYQEKAIRILCSKIYTFVCRLLISKNISDYSAGFRFYSIKSLNKLIKEKQIQVSQHLENLLFYYENKFNIDEFPAQYKDTDENSKSIYLTHILIFIYQLSNILVQHYFRKLKKLNL